MPAANATAASGCPVKLEDKTVFVFDWDGTLFDSMTSKPIAFANTASSYLGEKFGVEFSVGDAERIYRSHSGTPRAEIFDIMADGLGIRLDDRDRDIMSERLFGLNRTGLAAAPLFADGLRLLDRLAERDAKIFLSSSVPQSELDHFTTLKLDPGLHAGLGGIFGSREGFSKGPGHIGEILRCTGCSPDTVLMIGDDIADDRLSEAAGVDCIIVDRDGLVAGQVRATVLSLDEILNG